MPLKTKHSCLIFVSIPSLSLEVVVRTKAGMENIGNTDRRIPLTISATVSRYTAIDKKYLRHPHANRERLYHRIFRW